MNAAWNLFQSQHKANLARDRPDRTPMLAMLEICVQFYTRNHEKCTNCEWHGGLFHFMVVTDHYSCL